MTDAASFDERSLVETVWHLLDADSDIDPEVSYLVVAALESEQALADQLGGGVSAPEPPETAGSTDEPAGAFLREITVSGFRGIGPEATLALTPYPGLTVVSGRNGSGKSSFAEALEYALTGESYRWKRKGTKLWRDSWRNLHSPDPCQVRVTFTVEDGPVTTVGAQWPAGADLDDAELWSQRAGEKRRPGLGALGWSTAIEIYRPILSYDEIGGLLTQEPSKLYDALAKLLALDEINDAEKRLKVVLNELSQPRAVAKEALRRLQAAVATSTDGRAATLRPMLKKRPPNVEAVAEFADASSHDTESTLTQLRTIADLTSPSQDDIEQAARELRDALESLRTVADDSNRRAEARAEILRTALQYRGDGPGDVACPVCGKGQLDDDWETHAREVLNQQDRDLARYRSANERVRAAEVAARTMSTGVNDVAPIDDVELVSLADYRAAVGAARAVPVAVGDLPGHLEITLPAVRASLERLQCEAADIVAQQEDAWSPIAESISHWVALERIARQKDTAVARVKAAHGWVRQHAQELRDRRLEPIADSARRIWSELRQESNVEIANVTLQGTNTQRRAVLTGSVDGEPAGAISVMSQGELHALALALFLPRATASRSPFRFIVLDDPIQAMDPAKIDGLLAVLGALAVTRQIIVFSHDDRLATAVRQNAIRAQLLEVTRETGSRLVVKQAESPALRYTEDAFALIVDDKVPDEVKRRAAPVLFRLAIEAAAKQVYFTRRNVDGASQAETEKLWSDVKSATGYVALALKGSREADMSGWKAYRAYRGPTLGIATRGSHGKIASVTKDDVNDLRRTVADIVADT
ncbi:ATP-binding protein [Gordonia sinesedis]